MKEKINPDNDCHDPSEEYFLNKDSSTKTEEYFPLETLKPPHY